MTWCSEYSATPGFFLASSAICCRFVYRFAGFRVPSRVSRQQFSLMASPFSPVGPIGQVPRLHRYYGDATPSCLAHRRLMISPSGSRASLPRFVLSLARSRQTGGGLSGPGAFRCRRPPFRLSTRGQHRTSQVPCQPVPYLCRAPRPRPDRNVLADSGHPDAAPASNATKAPAST